MQVLSVQWCAGDVLPSSSNTRSPGHAVGVVSNTVACHEWMAGDGSWCEVLSVDCLAILLTLWIRLHQQNQPGS